jgi:hypothetical protein
MIYLLNKKLFDKKVRNYSLFDKCYARNAPRCHNFLKIFKGQKNLTKKNVRKFFVKLFFNFFFGYRCFASNLESACKPL